MLLDRLSPTQKRILDALSDGCQHRTDELTKLLDDDLGGASNLIPHISWIRKFLPQGEGIAFIRLDGVTYYQLVRKVAGGRVDE